MELSVLSEVFGGVGLFLIGMVLATDGLRSASGDALRRILLRFTGGPIKALLSGAAMTALVQSSSATTVATIGFVSAGLLSFHQALGLIFGANLGTTATGWIVALLGLKFTVSKVALPLVGLGAMMRLFARGRMRDIGVAIAGFGILFVGLDVLQAGMAGISEFITPERLPSDTWGGRTLLVGIGVVMTAVMQSSSAAIATTLTALHAGTISMIQAAAIAIGVNIGTTVTAGLAAVGAGTSARRTAVAHFFFNVATGLVAFALLPILVRLISAVGNSIDPGDAALALAAFHTVFNIIGVVLFFPFLKRFADFVERVVPRRETRFTHRLQPSLASEGGLAIEAVRATALDMSEELIEVAQRIIAERQVTQRERDVVREIERALSKTNAFVGAIHDLDHVGEHTQTRHVDVIHALDYIGRITSLLSRESHLLAEDVPENVTPLRAEASLALALVHDWLEDDTLEHPAAATGDASKTVARMRKELRDSLLQETALGDTSPDEAGRLIDVARHFDQLAYYVWRLSERLAGERRPRSMKEPTDVADDAEDETID